MDIRVNSQSSSDLISFIVSNRTRNDSGACVPNNSGSHDPRETELCFASIIQNELFVHGQYIFSVIVLALFLVNARFAADDQQTNLLKELLSVVRLLHWRNCNYPYVLFTAACFLLFAVLLPLLVALWLCVLCYRQYVHFLVKVSNSCMNLWNVWLIRNVNARALLKAIQFQHRRNNKPGISRPHRKLDRNHHFAKLLSIQLKSPTENLLCAANLRAEIQRILGRNRRHMGSRG